MQVKVFAKTTNGLPTTTEMDDLTGRTEAVEFTRAALWGDLSARVAWVGTLEEGFRYAEQYLGNPLTIYSPDSTAVWEGLIWSVRFGVGQRRRVRSLDGYASDIALYWRDPDTGSPLSGHLEDTAATAVYGFIRHTINGGEIASVTLANAILAKALAERTRLLWTPESGTIGAAGTVEGARIDLQCVGWYRTLWYQEHFSTATTEADISTVMQEILTARCPFISTDYSQMASVGVNVSRRFDKAERPGEIFKRLLTGANGYTFGLDTGRVPYLRANKRTSTTVDYVERLDGVLEDASGSEVPLYDVRPDTVLRQAEFVPTSAAISAAVDSVESVYLAETTYSTTNGGQLSYRPAIAGVDGEIEA